MRNRLQQSHAGLSVLSELCVTGNKHLAVQAACSDLRPLRRPVARSESNSLQQGMRRIFSRSFWLTAETHRIVAVARLERP